jgi:release factor glutamine methyltransferase
VGTKLAPEVEHEPDIALFAEEEGLAIYRKIITKDPEYLTSQGWLLFELGAGEADSVKALMSEYFINVNIAKDLAGIDRIIYGQLMA